MTEMYETMAYRRLKVGVKRALQEALGEITPPELSVKETREWAPEMLGLLQKACNEVISELVIEVKKKAGG